MTVTASHRIARNVGACACCRETPAVIRHDAIGYDVTTYTFTCEACEPLGVLRALRLHTSAVARRYYADAVYREAMPWSEVPR